MKEKLGIGYCSAEIRCADISGLLRNISNGGIALRNCVRIDELTVRVIFRSKDAAVLSKICSQRGGEWKVVESNSLRFGAKRIVSRPVIWTGFLFLILFSIVLPRRILFVSVEGNKAVPTSKIIDAARNCGLAFGVSGKGIRSEEIKNSMICLIPQLRWIGVNVRGCGATISVTEMNDRVDHRSGITNIVAAIDGVITDCTVVSGAVLCQPGQAVKRGEILVSGFSKDSLSAKGTRSSGEIFGNTIRDLKIVMPTTMNEKGKVIGRATRLFVLVGKKRLFFYNNSRISGATCDKMYKEYYVSLPNGVQLPFGLGFEQNVVYEDLTNVSDFAQITALKEAARSYLVDQMVSGEIRGASETIESKDGLMLISGVYICHELIGREELEDVLQYGENN